MRITKRKTNQLKLKKMTNLTNIKEGQKITFKVYGDAGNFTVYTKKVQSIYIQKFDGLIKYNVNSIGSGTAHYSVDIDCIIDVK